MNNSKKIFVVALGFLTLLSPRLWSADPTAAPAAAPAQDPAQAQAMAEMMKKGAPNEHHQVLSELVGTWEHTVKWRMTANAPEQEMKGTNTNKLIMDGRFLQQETQGEAKEGMPPFQGLGLTGYDTVKQEYNSIWLDNMGTGMMIANGQFDAANKTITESGTFSCPLKGPNQPFRAEWNLVDNDHYNYSMYSKDDAGKEFKSLEVNYTRKA